MHYQSEKELQIELASLDFGWPYPTICVRREVPVGGQIPDIVFVGFKGSLEPIPWPRSWSYRHSFVSWLLKQHPRIDANTVAKRAFETAERTNSIIQDLAKSGAIVTSGSGYLELDAAIATQEAEVIAIEVKLFKWKRALEQARVYKRFANIVIVAMDRDGIPGESDAMEEFERSKVGLCSVANGAIEWLVEPPLIEGQSSPDNEYLIRSATASDRQALWSWRKPLRVSLQA